MSRILSVILSFYCCASARIFHSIPSILWDRNSLPEGSTAPNMRIEKPILVSSAGKWNIFAYFFSSSGFRWKTFAGSAEARYYFFNAIIFSAWPHAHDNKFANIITFFPWKLKACNMQDGALVHSVHLRLLPACIPTSFFLNLKNWIHKPAQPVAIQDPTGYAKST